MKSTMSQSTKQGVNRGSANPATIGAPSDLKVSQRPRDIPTCEDDSTRIRAYDIYLREGRPDGQAKAHWAQAERELNSFQGHMVALGHAG